MKTVTTTVRMLRQFTAQEPALGVSELARRLGLDKATVHRVLKTLHRERFVEQDPLTKRYRLGLAVLDVASSRLAGFEFLAAAAAEIRRLSARTGESLSIHAPDGPEMVCLDFVEAAQPVRVSFFIGERFPVHVTSAGLATLATMPPEQWKPLLALARSHRGEVAADEEAFAALLTETRSRGFALADESFEEGVRAVAVAVTDAGGATVCTISLAAPSQRRSIGELAEFAPLLQQAAGRIRTNLGGRRGSIIESRSS